MTSVLMWLHGCAQRDTMHLLGNMLGLYFFGREVGRAFGGRALLALYLAGGLVGSLAHVAWKWSQIRGMASVCTVPGGVPACIGRRHSAHWCLSLPIGWTALPIY